MDAVLCEVIGFVENENDSTDLVVDLVIRLKTVASPKSSTKFSRLTLVTDVPKQQAKNCFFDF